MNAYVIQSNTGYRVWLADDVDHAIEQHEDAFGGEHDEDCITRCLARANEKCRIGHGCSVCEEAIVGIGIVVQARWGDNAIPNVKAYGE